MTTTTKIEQGPKGKSILAFSAPLNSGKVLPQTMIAFLSLFVGWNLVFVYIGLDAEKSPFAIYALVLSVLMGILSAGLVVSAFKKSAPTRTITK